MSEHPALKWVSILTAIVMVAGLLVWANKMEQGINANQRSDEKILSEIQGLRELNVTLHEKLVEVEGGIVVSIDSHEEFVSSEAQDNTQTLIGIISNLSGPISELSYKLGKLEVLYKEN